MDVDPMEMVDTEDDSSDSHAEKRKSKLNNWVAIMVAILATFMGIGKVKDDNIVQAMQQAQAKSIDAWGWYQAKKGRLQTVETALDNFEIQAAMTTGSANTVLQKKLDSYKALNSKLNTELPGLEKDAKGYDAQYDQLNYHDDQFDLSDALLAISISLFAVTSLTQKRWLFGLALVPTAFGVLFGLAGLFNLRIHSDLFARLLGT